jgi:hypothetical protein
MLQLYMFHIFLKYYMRIIFSFDVYHTIQPSNLGIISLLMISPFKLNSSWPLIT